MHELEQALATLLLVVETVATPDDPGVGLERQAEVIAAWKAANRTAAAKDVFKPLAPLFKSDPLVLRTTSSPVQLVLQTALSAGGELATRAEAVRLERGLEVWRVAQEMPLRLNADRLVWSASGKTVGVIGHTGYAVHRVADFVERESTKTAQSKDALWVDDTRLRALFNDSLVERAIGDKKTKTTAAGEVAPQTTAFVDEHGAAWIERAAGDEEGNGAGDHELVTLLAGASASVRTPIAGVAESVRTIAGLHHVLGSVDDVPFHLVVDAAGVVTRRPPADAAIDAVIELDGEAHLLLRIVDGDDVTSRVQDLDGNVVVEGIAAPWYQRHVQQAQGALWSGLGERIVGDVRSFPIAFDDPTRGPLGFVVTDDAVIALEQSPGAGDKAVLRRYVRAG